MLGVPISAISGPKHVHVLAARALAAHSLALHSVSVFRILHNFMLSHTRFPRLRSQPTSFVLVKFEHLVYNNFLLN